MNEFFSAKYAAGGAPSPVAMQVPPVEEAAADPAPVYTAEV